MKRDKNPYRSPRRLKERKAERERLRTTRRFSARYVVVGWIFAMIQLVRGGWQQLAASRSTRLPTEDVLVISGDFRELLAASRRQQWISGLLTAVSGLMLIGVSIAMWKYRARLLAPERKDSDLQPLMRRFALYGFAIACGSAALRIMQYVGFLSELPLVFDYLAMGIALAALALAIDLKVAWRAAIAMYVLAALGVLVSAFGLSQTIRRMLQFGQWQLQAWGWL
jgi:hypothetical protein